MRINATLGTSRRASHREVITFLMGNQLLHDVGCSNPFGYHGARVPSPLFDLFIFFPWCALWWTLWWIIFLLPYIIFAGLTVGVIFLLLTLCVPQLRPRTAALLSDMTRH